MHADRTTNQAEDSSASVSVGVNSHQQPNNSTRPSQSKSRFSPMLTFHRRVKNKIGLEEPAAGSCSRDNDKHCSKLSCNPPSSPLDAIPLCRQTAGSSLDVEDKVCFSLMTSSVGISLGWLVLVLVVLLLLLGCFSPFRTASFQFCF